MVKSLKYTKLIIIGVALSLAMSVFACGGDDVSKVYVELYGWIDDGSTEGQFVSGLPDFPGAEQVRVRVTEPDTRTVITQETASIDDGKLNLPELEAGAGLRMEIAIIGTSGGTIASGATPVFNFEAGPGSYRGFRAMVSEVNAFAPVGMLDGTDLVQSTFDARQLDQNWIARVGHTADLTSSGEVILVGGAQLATAHEPSHIPDMTEALSDIQLFNAANGYFTELAGDEAAVDAGVAGEDRLARPRAFHTVTALGDDQFLVVGGYRLAGDATRADSSIEIIDLNASPGQRVQPLLDDGGAAIELAEARGMHTATLRKSDGKVVIAGGMANNTSDVIDTVEIIDPERGTIESGIPMNSARVGHSAVLLEDDSTVWLIGGHEGSQALSSTEVVQDAETIQGPQMSRRRHGASAIHLGSDGNNQVVIIGGFTGVGGGAVDSYEFGNPLVGLSTSTGDSWTIDQARGGAAIFILPQSKEILVIGGYDPDYNPRTTVERLRIEPSQSPPLSGQGDQGEMFQTRGGFASALMSNGRVLIAGGEDASGAERNTAEYFNPLDPVRPRH